jgi:EamA domain-containing membrane protein RarD
VFSIRVIIFSIITSIAVSVTAEQPETTFYHQGKSNISRFILFGIVSVIALNVNCASTNKLEGSKIFSQVESFMRVLKQTDSLHSSPAKMMAGYPVKHYYKKV